MAFKNQNPLNLKPSTTLTRTPEILHLGYCPPLSNSWAILIMWLYIALNRTPNIDCYWVGAVPKLHPSTIFNESSPHCLKMNPC